MRPCATQERQPGDGLPLPVLAWRHPRVRGGAGLCMGRTDLRSDPRVAKRVARRIQAAARRQGLPRVVVTSPLRRCADVGRWLARWGWTHRIDPLLAEVNFGRWDGHPWSAVPRSDWKAWERDFLHHHIGGGESMAQVLARCAAWQPDGAAVVVTHGGWLSAHRWLQRLEQLPGIEPTMASWPAAPPRGSGPHRLDALPRATASFQR